MAPTKVIIDTDPGIDDINALLLALSANPDDIEVLLISVTYGNVDVQNCLRNVTSMFHVIEKEREWRRAHGLPAGFRGLDLRRPVVAAGPGGPLEEQQRMADYFHGIDGLGGIYDTHARLLPTADWGHLFDVPPPVSGVTKAAVEATQAYPTQPALFVPSKTASHLEIIDVLSSHPPHTITIVSLGPLTNLALAASANPAALARAKEIVMMGGALYTAGNVTPLAEFNFYADSIAAARVFALTSPIPASTMPPAPPLAPEGGSTGQPRLRPYPPLSELGSARLNIVLFPLDITEKHMLNRSYYLQQTEELRSRGSPLAEWHAAFMASVFRKMEKLHIGHTGAATSVTLHDPLCIWWVLDAAKRRTLEAQGGGTESSEHNWRLSNPQDIRIETTGQWSRGACVIDRRDRQRQAEDMDEAKDLGEREGDSGGWLSSSRGNRVNVVVDTPGKEVFVEVLLGTLFDSNRQ